VNEKREGEHLLVLLSGPEPQRTLLSQKLWQQVQGYKGEVVFVEGTNAAERPADIPGHISWYGKITKKDLQPLLQNAAVVICRSGYSTLMDLVAMNKKAIVIPTPGQTEQKYLARHLHRDGVFFACSQRNFDLHRALSDVKLFPFKELALRHAFEDHKAVLDNWLKTL
jgi:UDP-N-acetylglucosamine transferase subunit ALG13